MRKDMAHVLIDRPRTGGDGGKSYEPKGYKKRHQKMPLDEQPNWESSARGRKYGWDCKQLNDHISPLRRFLRSNVGRLWNDVHSEICQVLKATSMSQSHVRDHVNTEVEKNVQIIEGKIYDSEGRHEIYRSFYVHPETGILCYQERSKWRWRPREKNYIEKDRYHQYHCVKGIWYEVELVDIPTNTERSYFHDAVLSTPLHAGQAGHSLSRSDCRQAYGRDAYACKKRQLNKKEIKKLGLWETPLGIRAKEEMENEIKELSKKAG